MRGSVLLWWKWLSFRRLIVWGKCKEIPLISLLTRASSRSTFVEPLRGSWEPRLRNTPPVIGEFRLVSHTNGLPFRPLCPVSSMACQPMVHVYEAYTSWRHACSASLWPTGSCIIIPSSTFVRGRTSSGHRAQHLKDISLALQEIL